jgi:hypothetical protein
MTSDVASAGAPAALAGPAFSSLLRAVEGLRNHRAVLAMLGCTFVGVIVAGLLLALSGTLGVAAGLLASIVWIVAIGTGFNAAGLLQMDHARGISQRSTADALRDGLLCIPKLIVLGLAFLAVELVVLLVIAVLLVICKIPYLGALLFVVVFPLSVVLAGLTLAGLFVCAVLSLPAIWQGASIPRALAQTFAIVRSRLVEAVLLLVLLAFLSFAVGVIVFGVIGFGLLPTLGMSVSIVGVGGVGLESLMAMPQGSGSGHAVAGAIGGALLWAVAASLVGQVYLLGLSLVYLRVTEGLDLTASEEALRAAFDDARRRAAELGDKAREATHRDSASASAGSAEANGPSSVAPAASVPAASNGARAASIAPAAQHTLSPTVPATLAPTARATLAPGVDPVTTHPDIALPFDEPGAPPPTPSFGAPPAWSPPPVIAPLPPAPPLPATTTCPQCLSPVAPADVFCGLCGHRLQ